MFSYVVTYVVTREIEYAELDFHKVQRTRFLKIRQKKLKLGLCPKSTLYTRGLRLNILHNLT